MPKAFPDTNATVPDLSKPGLGLDLGSNCGWAIRYPSGTMVAGLSELVPRARHGQESPGMRYGRLRAELTELLSVAGGALGWVVYEEIARHEVSVMRKTRGGGAFSQRVPAFAAAHAYGGYRGHVVFWCDENRIPYTGINVAYVKRLATGKGNCRKELMMKAAEQRWPEIPIERADVADALWIAEAGFISLGGTTG